MSFDAMSYVKTLPDKGDMPCSDLLVLFIIAEKTFNDSGLCRVGQRGLREDVGMSESTMRRCLKRLEKRGTIKLLPARGLLGGGSNPGAIELLGFTQWLGKNRPEKKVRTGQIDRFDEPVKTRSTKQSLLTGSI